MKALLTALILVVGLSTGAAAAAGDSLWEALAAGNHVLLLRHALAPGVGDPPGFQRDDCATQRNLSAEGRQQAQALGERLRARGLQHLAVHASHWCRAWDTAVALGLDTPQRHDGLDSFFQQRARRDAILDALRDLLRDLHGGPGAVLVTHQVNITAMTGLTVGSGEGVVARIAPDGSLTVLGRLAGD
jgi:phosphohistidine phosphatase SixA